MFKPEQMNKPYYFIIFITALSLSTACRPEYVKDEKALAEYVQKESSGLVQRLEDNNFKLSLAYRPTDLIVAQSLDEDHVDSTITALRQHYNRYAYFVMSMSYAEKEALYGASGNYQAFSDNLQTLAFRLDQFLKLVTSSQDTVYLADFHYPRMYGMGAASEVLLVFEKEKIKSSDWIQIDLDETGLGHGRQRFKFKTGDLLKVPQIKFENI